MEDFLEARVRIHNGPNETIALFYARMIIAKAVIVGIGSFVAFPSLATFRTGYILIPEYEEAPNQWLLSLRPDKLNGNAFLFDEPYRLVTFQVHKLRGCGMQSLGMVPP